MCCEANVCGDGIIVVSVAWCCDIERIMQGREFFGGSWNCEVKNVGRKKVDVWDICDDHLLWSKDICAKNSSSSHCCIIKDMDGWKDWSVGGIITVLELQLLSWVSDWIMLVLMTWREWGVWWWHVHSVDYCFYYFNLESSLWQGPVTIQCVGYFKVWLTCIYLL